MDSSQDTVTPRLTRTRRELVHTLAQIPYFETLTQQDLLFLVRQGYPQTVPQLQYVCCEGDRANSFYIVLSGKVEVISLSKKKHIAVLYPGDFFGEIALFTGSVRVATCRTLAPSRLFVIHRDYLREMLIGNRELAEHIARKLLERQHTLVDLGIVTTGDNQEAGMEKIRKHLQQVLRL